MARKFLTPIDLSQLELQNARIQNLGSTPGSAVAGQIYFNTVQNAAYIWSGTAWVSTDATKLTGAIPLAALATDPLARANHTGQQAVSTISNFDSSVRAYTLNQFAAPAADIAMAGFGLTGLRAPTAPGHAAEYSWVTSQVQSAAAGISSKPPVRLLYNGTAALSGLAAVDGVTPNAGDRILVTGQSPASNNGVYNAASTGWTRTTIDGPPPGELEGGATWLVTEGTAWNGTQWRQATTGTITAGTTPISIVQFTASSTYTGGNGVQIVGTAISAQVVAGGGVLAAAGGLSLDTTIAARRYAAAVGDGASTSIQVNHGLNTQDVIVSVRQALTPFNGVECDWSATSASMVTLGFATAPTSGAYRVTVIG